MTLSRRQNNRGSILILVLWISAGLVILAVYFGDSMFLEYRAADNAVAEFEAAQAIEGASRYVRYVLANSEDPERLPEIELYENEQVPVGEGTFWLIGRGDLDYQGNEQVFGLTDECSKLNINTASQEMLELLPTMTTELAAAIVDWRDTDGEVTPGGAESSSYTLRDPKYNSKDAPFETVEELHLIIGADWDILYGEDTNRNGMLDPNEDDRDESLPIDNGNGLLDPGVLEYLTVYSREPNTRSDGSARIDVGDNDENEDLEGLLDETFGASRAQEISIALAEGPNEVGSILELYIRGEMTPLEFAQIEGDVTTSDDDALEGLINVNTADVSVLACIPGIGADYGSDLVSYRQGLTDELDSIAWVTNVLPQENSFQAGPFITSRSFQFSADLAAVGHEGRGFRREFFVFDTSGETPVVVYRRDRTRLGWPFIEDVRTELALDTRQRSRFE